MEGLEKFREAFEAYSDNYVIIGGTACDITMTELVFRVFFRQSYKSLFLCNAFGSSPAF
jgi:hypothetical protein